ncbi:MAG: CoA transferase [Chloroflexi bacterium]|nr:MAG: CoA transferase [Chloroflexota bacterium]
MTTRPRPLDGIRVLDIATFLAAPFCSTVLGEFGAEVIKVEQPGVGDPLRKFGTPHACGDSLVWLSESRNKKSITLNLRDADGAALLKRLVAESHIVVENFRTGTLEGWGLGYEDLKAVNPRIIMLRVTGYGQTGPKAREPGFARIAHAFSGLSYLAGEAGGKPLMPGSTTWGGYPAGTYGALGVLMALRVAEQTGEGQYGDIGIYEPVFRYLDEIAPAYEQTGFVRERMGADTVNVVPHSHYPTGDGHWIAIACTSDKMFARLARAMDQPELAEDARYATTPARLEHRQQVNDIVSVWTSSLGRDAVLERLREGEVPSGPIHSIADIFEDPQFAAREDIVRVGDHRVDPIAIPATMPLLSATPGGVDSLGPALGEHNEEIYDGLLGLEPGERAALARRGVI